MFEKYEARARIVAVLGCPKFVALFMTLCCRHDLTPVPHTCYYLSPLASSPQYAIAILAGACLVHEQDGGAFMFCQRARHGARVRQWSHHELCRFVASMSAQEQHVCMSGYFADCITMPTSMLVQCRYMMGGSYPKVRSFHGHTRSRIEACIALCTDSPFPLHICAGRCGAVSCGRPAHGPSSACPARQQEVQRATEVCMGCDLLCFCLCDCPQHFQQHQPTRLPSMQIFVQKAITPGRVERCQGSEVRRRPSVLLRLPATGAWMYSACLRVLLVCRVGIRCSDKLFPGYLLRS